MFVVIVRVNFSYLALVAAPNLSAFAHRPPLCSRDAGAVVDAPARLRLRRLVVVDLAAAAAEARWTLAMGLLRPHPARAAVLAQTGADFLFAPLADVTCRTRALRSGRRHPAHALGFAVVRAIQHLAVATPVNKKNKRLTRY